ncbi:hypothetical protein pgond44_14373 [Psychroflexus gondwanensis ACAM 44]|uniref:YcxB-like protein domain-containing protein n=1 Tax=Psychroflexus gondwanensis ACAM 44 TaxID=1189619 RepID=N1WVU0_9FLAO|nr:hypothetical protein [Psychroflexus gondwanensis]EMY79948.1 hypothetical protein pgond44_14373 [Psychroflexus gondwanensis ACAM 44]
MKIRLIYNKHPYQRDMNKYLFNDLKSDKIFNYYLLAYVLILILFILNKLLIINFIPEVIEFFTYVLGGGIVLMLLYTLVHYLIKSKEIKKTSYSLPNKEEYILFEDECVEYSWNHMVYRVELDSFKKLSVLDSTLFLIPKNKKSPLLRINKSEITSGDFEQIIEYIKQKWNK